MIRKHNNLIHVIDLREKTRPEILYTIRTAKEACEMLKCTEYEIEDHIVGGYVVIIRVDEMGYLGVSGPLTDRFRDAYLNRPKHLEEEENGTKANH